ncbi:MAG: RNA methyltransferase [Armatimonadetes bacterium]|nr:RNA methyltransferase [Armatimonadota bacterium]
MTDTEQAHLEGFLSVRAALESGSREVHALLLRQDKDDGQTHWLERQAAARGVPVRRVAAGEIEAQAGGKTHGGVLATVGPRRFVSLDDLLPPGGEDGWVVMLDGVEDPFNFGAAVRSLHAAGAAGLVVRPRNWLTAAATVARASAGASERLPTAVAETADAAAFFRGHGLAVACATDAPPSVSLYDADLSAPLFLLIGGEKRGLTRSFEAAADLRLRIPYARPEAYSLGTAAAAAVLGFEIMRQRSRKTPRTDINRKAR